MEASRATLAARYEAGESLRELARSAGVDYRTIRRRLDDVTEIRPRGRRPSTPPEPRQLPIPVAPLVDGRSWERCMTDRLREVRRHRPRWTFAEAWRQAVKDYPTPVRMAGTGDRLFEEDGTPVESLAAFFERACSDAWHGLSPALAHFSPALLLSADEGFTSTDQILA